MPDRVQLRQRLRLGPPIVYYPAGVYSGPGPILPLFVRAGEEPAPKLPIRIEAERETDESR